MERMGIDLSHTASTKPPFSQEMDKIIQKLNENVGSCNWNSIRTRHVLRTIENAVIIPTQEYPWTKIAANAVKEFPKWMDEHSNITDIDHTFAHAAIQPSLLDFDSF